MIDEERQRRRRCLSSFGEGGQPGAGGANHVELSHLESKRVEFSHLESKRVEFSYLEPNRAERSCFEPNITAENHRLAGGSLCLRSLRHLERHGIVAWKH